MNNRAAERKRLNLRWLLCSLAAIVPWLAISLIGANWQFESLYTPIFVLGLCSFFISLPMFRRFKLALWAMQERDEAGEAKRLQQLSQSQQRGLWVASVPAWIGALGAVLGLELIAGLMLVAASVLIARLYRIPAHVSAA